MASSPCEQHQPNSAAKLQPPIEPDSGLAPLLPEIEAAKDGHRSGGYKINEVGYPRSWTPEPEPFDPDTFAAWGRKHYGDAWYEKRKDLFDQRNYCRYQRLEIALRKMEREIEGRLINRAHVFWMEPAFSYDSSSDSSGEQGNSSGEQGNSSGEPGNSSGEQGNSSGEQGDSVGRQRTPKPEDPLERLEWKRKHWGCTDEFYEKIKAFLTESKIDEARTRRDDEIHKQKDLEAWQAIQDLPRGEEYRRPRFLYMLQVRGQTEEQYHAEMALLKKIELKQAALKPAALTARGSEPAIRFREPFWRNKSAGVAQPQASPPRPMEDASRKARGGRITKGTEASRPNCQPIRRDFARDVVDELGDSVHIQYQPIRRDFALNVVGEPRDGAAHVQYQPIRRDFALDVMDEPGDGAAHVQYQSQGRQRKIYTKQRASRRLAGQPPEFGVLREARAPYKTQHSNAPKSDGSGLRSNALLKEQMVIKGAKPQGVSKSRRAGQNCPKASAE